MSRDWTLYLADIADACQLIEDGAARFRDVVAHRCFALDPAVVWSIVQTKVPALSRAASRVLAEADRGDASGAVP